MDAAKAARRPRARSTSATRRVDGARRRASWARPRSTRARWSAAGRARCSRASRRSTRSTSASAIPERDYLEYAARGAEQARQAGERTPLHVRAASSPTARCIPRRASSSSSTATSTPQTGHDPASRPRSPIPGGIVRPGQYARVRVAIDEKKGAILVPQRAVHGAAGHLQRGRGRSRTTRSSCAWSSPRERVGTLWVIDSGLKAGERVVVEGVQKVRAGHAR